MKAKKLPQVLDHIDKTEVRDIQASVSHSQLLSEVQSRDCICSANLLKVPDLHPTRDGAPRASQHEFLHNSEGDTCLQIPSHSSPLISNYTYLSSFAGFSLLSSESACPICGNSALTISGVRIILNSVSSVSLKNSKIKNNWALSF